MAYRIFWTPIAVQDLRDICDFISRDNPVAAQRTGEELIKQSEAMGAFPQSGRMVPEKKDPQIRETLVGSYRIPDHEPRGANTSRTLQNYPTRTDGPSVSARTY